MPNIAPSFVTVNPSFTMPELILPYSQASGAFDLLSTGAPLTRLSDGDLYVYIKRIDLRTKMAAGQSAYNQLPSVGIALSQISTATYLQRVRAEYDHHDTAAMGRWGVSIVEAQRLGMRQGHYNLLRTALLYGYNPANGEGLINTQGATSLNLPPDSNAHTTVQTYDNGQMAFFMLSQISALKTRTNQIGIPRHFTILAPQRIIGLWEYYGIVQVTQFQRVGAGSASITGTVEAVGTWNGDKIIWAVDDTLIGKGAGGTDAVIITMPEVAKPTRPGINTNTFATLAPGLEACTIQFTDMIAPKEIPTPMPGGAIDVLSEMRVTSGWAPRPEAVTIISMQF